MNGGTKVFISGIPHYVLEKKNDWYRPGTAYYITVMIKF